MILNCMMTFNIVQAAVRRTEKLDEGWSGFDLEAPDPDPGAPSGEIW